MKAFLFNPENDLALASGEANYTAPKNAALLHRSGAVLPLWYASPGDYVLSDSVDNDWLAEVDNAFNLRINVTDKLPEAVDCVPWGWSENAVSQFRKAGVGADVLPSVDAVGRMRNLSHRRTCIEVYKRLADVLPGNFEAPVEAYGISDVERYAYSHSMKFYYKAPWSSTGRGVASSDGQKLPEILRRCGGIIGRQGSVMLEPLFDKVLDFAMLFYARADGEVVFSGYSMFVNSGTSYSGNILMSDCEIRRNVAELTGYDAVDKLAERLPGVLSEIIGGNYRGYFGVDMMVYRDRSTGNCRIAPCVEINLRMTMGVVAHIWRERFLAPTVERAMLSVSFNSSVGSHRAVVESGKLVSGVLDIVPPGNAFRITVGVEKGYDLAAHVV